MLKILQVRLQQYVNQELSDVQARFRKVRGTRDQIVNIHWIIEKTRKFPPKICFTDSVKGFDFVDHNKLWRIPKQMWIPDHLTCLWETCMQVKKQWLETDMKKWTDSKLGKEYIKTVCCHPAYLTYIQTSSCKMPGWMNHKLESKLTGYICTTSNIEMILIW